MKKPPSKKGVAQLRLAIPLLEKHQQKIHFILQILIVLGLFSLIQSRPLPATRAAEQSFLTKHIMLNDNGHISDLTTRTDYVAELLAELDIQTEPSMRIHPAPDSMLYDNHTIFIERAKPTITGIASWYAAGLPDPELYTAASRQFARGTRLKVTSQDTGRSVLVTVNDYGPEAWTGREIDLSRGAFREIQALGLGLTNVTIEKQ